MKKTLLLLGVSLLLSGAVKLDEATFMVGQKYYRQGLYTEAEKRFLEIVRKFPDSSKFRESLYLLGRTYANMGNDKAALQYYKVLLNKAATVSEKQGALLGIAKSWLQLGVYDKAAEFYSFYASEYPESVHTPGALYYAGIAREREGNVSSAIEKYRQIFELYPNSDFQGRAIEKVAVLEQDTPESLWKEPVRTAKTPQGLFPETAVESAPIPGYTPPPARAQNKAAEPAVKQAPQNFVAQEQFQPAAPSVITQMIQSPPLIITQTVQAPPIIVTQTIIAPMTAPLPQAPAAPAPAPAAELSKPVPSRELPKEIQAMISNKVVVFSNGQVVLNGEASPEESAKIAQYRRQWEAERLQEEKTKKLQAASAALDQMLELSDNKNQLLKAKESSLLEKQNGLRSYIYSGMSNANLLKPVPYKGVQNNTVKIGSEMDITTNTQTAPPPAAAEPAPPADTAYPDDYADGYGGYPEATDYPEDAYLDEEAGLEADIDETAAADAYPLVD